MAYRAIPSALYSLAAILTALFAGFAKDCDELRKSTFRLHILANSDSEHDQRVTTSWHFNPWENNGQTYDTSDNPWYSVHDDIFDLNNWKRLD